MNFETFVIEKLSILKAKLNAVKSPIITRASAEKQQDAAYISGWNEANEGVLFGIKTYDQKDIPIKIGERETKAVNVPGAGVADSPAFVYNKELSPLENILKFRQEIVNGHSFLDSNETIEFSDRNGQSFICSIAMANVLMNEYNKQFLGEWHPELFVFRVK